MHGSHARRGGRRRPSLSATVTAILAASALHLTVGEAWAAVAIGTSAGDFLGFEIGAGPVGMAGAQTGIASGVTAQYWNPACLSNVGSPQISAMHATWLQDLQYEWAGYARPIGSRSGVASLSVAYFHLPSISGVDEFDNPTGKFRVYDLALTAGYARSVARGISVGANAKFIRQNLANISATGGAVDLGATAQYAGTTVGAAIQNLGPDLSFGGVPYPLPRQIRIGAGRHFYGGRVLLAADYNIPRDYYRDVRVGTEIRPHAILALRAGYRHEIGAQDDPATGFSFGLGINFRQFGVDYAMTSSDAFDDVHRLSFGYTFGGAGEKKPEPKRPPQERPVPQPPVGPPVIVQTTPEAPGPSAAKLSVAAKAGATASLPQSSVPSPKEPSARPAPQAPPAYAVILPGYQSKEGAQAEIRALELLGFQTKHAQISMDPKRSGYMITLARMKSKSNADEVAASLQRMSFRANVEIVER